MRSALVAAFAQYSQSVWLDDHGWPLVGGRRRR
jgi:hypothetical protein